MREKCGLRGKGNEVVERNTSQRNRDIKSSQNDDERNSEERPNQIENETSSGNNDVKNGKEDVSLQTSYTTPIDIAAYPTLESLDGKENEEPTKLAPSYPRRNYPTKKNPDFMGMNDSDQNFPGSTHKDSNSRKNLTIYHQNIRGISNKTDEFQDSLYHNRPQVICLTEHHLKTEEITTINLDQYKLGAFFCRQEFKGGGVSIYISKFLQCSIINLEK